MHECSQRPALLHNVLKQVSQTFALVELYTDRAALNCVLITVARREMQCISTHRLASNLALTLLQIS